ncbi:MAG: urea ABC transporter permease subunit UrtB [Pseudomonadota bacterium]
MGGGAEMRAFAAEEVKASAVDAGALLTELVSADYERKAQIANELVNTEVPSSLAIIEALADGRLFVEGDEKTVVLQPDETTEAYVDPLTGAAVAGIKNAELSKIRVNNRLRRDLRSLSSRLALISIDEKVRRAAANDAFISHDADSLPAIELALSKEEVGSIRDVLAQARASIILESETASEADKIAAIKTMQDRGDEDALSALMGVAQASDGAVKTAADAAVSDVQASLSYWGQLQNIYYGLSLGSVLLLAAIGLAITFGVMGVINMAHGEMIMLGAYTTFVVQQFFEAYAPGMINWALLFSIPAAFLVAGGAGIVIERTIIRFLYGRPLETLLATWGLSLVIQQAVRSIFGPTNKPVSAPVWMSGSFDIGHLSVTYSRLWIIVFSMIVLSLLMAFLKYTHFGLQMRAVTQNRKMASAMGVRTNWVDALTFGLGSGVAGIAGVALSQIDNVSPNLGQTYIIDSFMVVVFGGVGNLWGTLVGAMTLGVANKFLEPYAGAVVGKILVLVFIILFIQRRPRGLFALKGRSVEA